MQKIRRKWECEIEKNSYCKWVSDMTKCIDIRENIKPVVYVGILELVWSRTSLIKLQKSKLAVKYLWELWLVTKAFGKFKRLTYTIAKAQKYLGGS